MLTDKAQIPKRHKFSHKRNYPPTPKGELGKEKIEDMARSMRVQFRISKEEYQTLEQKIRKTYAIPPEHIIKYKLGDYMRQAALKGKITDIGQLTAAVASIRTELNKIGVNINQLAHRANSDGYNSSIASDFIELLDRAKKVLSNIVKDNK
jgi:hypothetical protein